MFISLISCILGSQGGATGRLLKFTPKDGSTAVVAGNMWFANGCALSADGTFVAVAETTSMRIRRVYVAGPKVWNGIGALVLSEAWQQFGSTTWRVHRAEHVHNGLGNSVLQAGTVDTLIDRLPGFPDGVSRSAGAEDGSFWVGRVKHFYTCGGRFIHTSKR